MKQVTMESVKQRIADLESAGKVVGGLSLSSEFELACLRELVAVTEQRDAVVAEMVTLQNFCKNASFDADYEAELGMEYGCFTDALNAIKTPATDAAIASLRAEGVEMLRQKLEQEITKCYQDEQIGLDSAVTLATDFAVQLRSQSAPSPKAAAIARQFEQVKGVQS